MSARSLPLVDRLILREVAVPLAVGLLAILQLLLILQLLQLNEVVFGSAVSLEDLVRVTAALAPHFLVTAVPLALMLGIQLGMGRLAGDHELLALGAAGTHPLRLYRMPAALGVALAVLVGALAHWAEPWGISQLNRVLNDVIKRNLKEGLEPGVFNDGLPRFMIYVANEERDPSNAYATWRGVLIEDDVGDGAPLLALAESGGVADAQGEALALRLRRGELHRMEPGGETVARFDEGTFLVGVQGPVMQKNRFSSNEAGLTGPELRRRVRELRRSAPREADRLRLEAARRWAMPLACFAFAVLSVPLALIARGSRGTAWLMTVAVFIAYYVLSRIATAFAAGGMNAYVAGFLPVACILALAAAQTRELLRRGVGKRL